MTDQLKLFTEKQKEFLTFLKAKYHLYHLSNVFFRDLHYGAMAFLDMNGIDHTYSAAEELTVHFVESLEKQGILRKVDRLAYVLNYPEFRKSQVKPSAPAKPAAQVAAKPLSPATQTAKPAPAPVAPVESTQAATQS